MPNSLSKYNIDDLAERVESGGDSDGQKAEPILIAKSMIELQNSIIALQQQIPITGSEIRGTIRSATEELSKTVDKLNDEIKEYSKASDRYAKAMRWLTFGLVMVGILQVVIAIIKR